MWSKIKKDKVLNGDGRWLIQAPEGYRGKKVIEGRYIYQHRYLMEQKIGRLLNSTELVHHINGDETDDRIENLEIVDYVGHRNRHSKGRAMVPLKCSFCGINFTREKRNDHGSERYFCSEACRNSDLKLTHPIYGNSGKEIAHGTYGKYRKGCRCDACKEANRLRMKKYLNKKGSSHSG